MKGLLLALSLVPAVRAAPEYTELFYASGKHRIQAYLYKPAGEGPFPAVIYNHGARIDRERSQQPHVAFGRMLTKAGFAALVIERRGYGKSTGLTFSQEIPSLEFPGIVKRMRGEADDVIAAAELLRTRPDIDAKRISLMGWSYGGVASLLAAAKDPRFAGVVAQADAAQVWNQSFELKDELVAAAGKIRTPTLFMVDKEDDTTAAATTLAKILEKNGVRTKVIVYESGFKPAHELFSKKGFNVWRRDALDFLSQP